MNKSNLEIFCRVIEEGSISQAARVSYVSQPAVTNQIRLLEKYYGVALFNRNKGKLELTEAGTELYPFAKEIIDCFCRSEEAIKDIKDIRVATLHIGASLTIGEYLLPGIFGEFQKKNKNMNFNLTIGNTPNIIAQLENRDIDVALVEGIVTKGNLNIKKFGEDELILVVPSDHHFNTRDNINISELVEETMISREKNAGIRKIVGNILKENHVIIDTNSYMELGSTQSIKSAVEAGLGISILPKLSLTKELELGVIKQVDLKGIQITRDLSIVEIPSRFPKSSVKSFLSFVKKHMNQNGSKKDL